MYFLITVGVILKIMVLHFISLLVICLTATLIWQFQDILKLNAPVKIGATGYELVSLLIFLFI